MDRFKEFEGKNLDACIKSACEYFDAPREKLEIEIIQDAKSGIFGIVLARKAKIRARRAQLANAVEKILKQPQAPQASSQAVKKQDAEKEAQEARQPKKGREKASGRSRQQPRNAQQPVQRKGRPNQEEAPKAPEPVLPESHEEDDAELAGSTLPLKSPDELDGASLEAKTVEIVNALVSPVAGHPVEVKATVDHGNIHARVAWQGDAGLLIGREGQTLASLQYLASRMLSHTFNAPLRVQLDIGDYRSRQDEKLRALALSLAEKARQNGRSFSTRPLSSYHRRIIHMALQDQPDLLTRSSGDGPLKRVIIAMRRNPEK